MVFRRTLALALGSLARLLGIVRVAARLERALKINVILRVVVRRRRRLWGRTWVTHVQTCIVVFWRDRTRLVDDELMFTNPDGMAKPGAVAAD